MLLLAVVSHRHKNDRLIISQGGIVNSQRFALESPTALQRTQRTRPKAQTSALKVQQADSFPPAEHVHSTQVEPRPLQLGQYRRDSCEVVEDCNYSVHRIPVELIHIEPRSGC